MKIGFTGTRFGMTPEQKRELRQILTSALCGEGVVPRPEFHHGDCIGADAEAHDIARELGFYIVIHPPTDPKHRAFCEGHEWRVEKGHFARNRDIVNETQRLVGASLTTHRTDKGGTWYTIDYARKPKQAEVRLPTIVLWPDGSRECR